MYILMHTLIEKDNLPKEWCHPQWASTSLIQICSHTNLMSVILKLRFLLSNDLAVHVDIYGKPEHSPFFSEIAPQKKMHT